MNKKQKYEYISLFIILLVPLVTANTYDLESGKSYDLNFSAGETYYFYTDFVKPGYVIENNTYDLEGLVFIFDGEKIELFIASNYKPDKFTLLFFDMDKDIVLPSDRSGGGGSRTITKIENVTKIEYIEVEVEVDDEPTDTTKENSQKTNDKILLNLIFIITSLLIILSYFLFRLLNERRLKNNE
jgi:hypothetical protein